MGETDASASTFNGKGERGKLCLGLKLIAPSTKSTCSMSRPTYEQICIAMFLCHGVMSTLYYHTSIQMIFIVIDEFL